jgi:hypothetical protein
MVLRGGCVDCEFLSMLGAATPAARGRSRGEEEGGAKSLHMIFTLVGPIPVKGCGLRKPPPRRHSHT